MSLVSSPPWERNPPHIGLPAMGPGATRSHEAKKPDSCCCYCLTAETQIAACWQRMQAILACFPGDALLVCNF